MRGWAIAALGATVVLLGCIDTESAKLMNNQKGPPCDGCEPKYFQAPFFQTWVMYLGEVFSGLYYLAYLIYTRYNQRKSEFNAVKYEMSDYENLKIDRTQIDARNKLEHSATDASSQGSSAPLEDAVIILPPAPFYIWTLPMLADFTCSVALYVALVFCPAATVQLIRGLGIIFTAALTTVCLGHALTMQQIFACLLATGGMICSSTVFMNNDDAPIEFSAGQKLWGIFFATLGTILASGVFATQEWVSRRYSFHPLQGMFFTGVHGSITGLVVMGVVHGLKVENIKHTFYMMSQNFASASYADTSRNLCVGALGILLAISVYNVAGLAIVVLSSGLFCNAVFAARTVSVWIADVFILRYTKFHILDLLGVICLIFALFMFELWSFLDGRLSDRWAVPVKRVLLYQIGGRQKDRQPLKRESSDEEFGGTQTVQIRPADIANDAK